MADEHEHRGPVDEGNGGPVTPGAEAPRGGAHGTGSNGSRARAEPVIAAESGPTKPIAGFGGLWLVLTFSAVILMFLLVFIVQNDEPTVIKFLGAEGTLPSGVALLFAAALGVLLAAVPGYGRILQLHRELRRREHR